MSMVSDIRRAMRPADLAAWETEGLFKVIARLLQDAPFTAHTQPVDIPALTDSGNAYLLRLFLRGGRIVRFTVDHDPDQSEPSFVAYLEKRAEWIADRSAGGRHRCTECGRSSDFPLPIDAHGRHATPEGALCAGAVEADPDPSHGQIQDSPEEGR